MKQALLIAAAVAGVLAPALARAQSGPFPPKSYDTRPPVLARVDVEERLGFPLPRDLTFTDENGKALTTKDLFSDGKPVVMILSYYKCPMLCELVWQGAVESMKQIDLDLGKDYRAVTVSFDKRDRAFDAQRKQATVLAALEERDVEPHWPFLVAEEDTILRLTNSVGYGFAWDQQTEQYAHPAVVIVFTAKGEVSRYLYGIQYKPRDLKLALIEAGQGKTGSFADKLIMSCFRYDPASRRYGVYIFGILRIGSVVTVLGLGTYLFFLWRRDRRERSQT